METSNHPIYNICLLVIHNQGTFVKEFADIELVISTILFDFMWRVCYCMKNAPLPALISRLRTGYTRRKK